MPEKFHISLEWKEILNYDALAHADVKRTGIFCFALGPLEDAGQCAARLRKRRISYFVNTLSRSIRVWIWFDPNSYKRY